MRSKTHFSSITFPSTSCRCKCNFSFTADNDTCVYPDRVMVLGTKLKYFEAKGFDTTALYRDYLAELETAIAQDTAAANLSFAPRPGTVLIGYDNIPDSGYGTSST